MLQLLILNRMQSGNQLYGNKNSAVRIVKVFLLFLGLGAVISCQNGAPVDVIEDNDYDSLSFNPFVEADFPYITTSLDVREIGEAFPQENYAPRVLAINLSKEDTYMAFDTDLLRWVVGWTGDFVSMTNMSQISYSDSFNKSNQISTILGSPKFANGIYPGGSLNKPDFEDPRAIPEENTYTWGPIDPSLGKWKGQYVHEQDVILNYEISGVDILEWPGVWEADNERLFLRRVATSAHKDPLFINVAEVGDVQEIKAQQSILTVTHNSDSITAVFAYDNQSKELVDLHHYNDRYIALEQAPSEKESQVSILLWKGTQEEFTAIQNEVTSQDFSFELPNYKKGGENLWDEKIYTKAKLAEDTAAYVLDEIVLPMPNPWKRNVRVGDIAFFKNGNAAVVTFEGDVWILKNLNRSLSKVEWTRFASGLYEPMSIEIVDDEIYVFGKDGIVRLHDVNKDGMADYYENFSNIMEQSMESREWAGDMVADPNGGFFIAKGSTLNLGPKFAPFVMTGFREGNRHSGTILQVSADGKQVDYYATGLRIPYIGVNPENSQVYASDQQGNFVPSTPVYKVQKGDYYGVPASSHSKVEPEVTPPLVWIPHNVDRSGISQVWVGSKNKKMGPLRGSLLHVSFGRPGLFRVLEDTGSEIPQGAVQFIQQDYPAPTLQATEHPKDGQIYIAGFNIWGSNSKGISALTRLRYTGVMDYQVQSFETGEGGLVLRFNEVIENVDELDLKRWDYLRTEEYGSGHYKLDGSPGQEDLVVLDYKLSKDKKSVLLVVNNMEKAMQYELNYRMTFRDGKSIKDGFYFTVHNVGSLVLNKEFGAIDFQAIYQNSAAKAEGAKESEISAERGEALFKQLGCNGCHAIDGGTAGMYGPPLDKMYGSEREFTDGTKAIADDEYIKESVLEPLKKIVKGYNPEMPSYVGILDDNDIASITLYLKGLNQ